MAALTTKELPPLILMGGSHHNGLGLVRSFGIHGIRPYGIIVCPADRPKESFIAHSRYWKKTFLVNSDEEALEVLRREFGSVAEQTGQKPVVITWSDSTEMAVDQHLDELKNRFVLPSCGGTQGQVTSLMDKERQVAFCRKHELNMAKSVVINLEQGDIPDDISYPVMLKPVTSAEGEKLDIRKCQSEDEARNYMKELRHKGYYRILVQEFVDYDKEFVFFGSTGKEDSYILCEKERVWPVVGGSSSFIKVSRDPEVLAACKKILSAMHSISYQGCFDVDLFQVTGKGPLVNEFNWRNSGVVFAALGPDVPYGLVYYYSQCGSNSDDLLHKPKADKDFYAMDEATDLRHVVYGKLPLSEWLRDCHRTQSFALWFTRDPIPTIRQYAYLFREMLRRRKG